MLSLKKELIVGNCLYMLRKKYEVVYIGMSSRGLSRPLDHFAGNKKFDEILLLKEGVDFNLEKGQHLVDIEREYILKYRPKYNKTHQKIIREIDKKLLEAVALKDVIKVRKNKLQKVKSLKDVIKVRKTK